MRGMMGGQAGLLFAGMASFILMGAGQSLYGPALPVFGREMGLSLADASLVISAHWVGCFIGVAVMFMTRSERSESKWKRLSAAAHTGNHSAPADRFRSPPIRSPPRP